MKSRKAEMSNLMKVIFAIALFLILSLAIYFLFKTFAGEV